MVLPNMSPPSYADLCKPVKDLFTKSYNIGLFKVESISKAGLSQEMKFKTGASHEFKSGNLTGNLDVKYKFADYGIVVTEKWKTCNTLGTTIEILGHFAPGLKLTLDSSYAVQKGTRSGKVKADYTGSNVKVNCDLELDGAPVITLATVGEYDGWLFGVQSSFDVASTKMKGNFALGRRESDYTVLAYINNGAEIGASFFNKLAPNFEIGAQLGYTIDNLEGKFDLATKYSPSKDLEIKAKISSDSKFAVAAIHRLSNNLKLILSSEFGLTKLNTGGHTVGLGLEFKG